MKKIVVFLELILMAVGSAYSQSCAPAPSGLMGWWPGEGNAIDRAGGNNGVSATNVSYGAGRVGLGFALNDTNAYIRIPASASLNVGTGAGLTLEAWIYPTDVTGLHPIFEWNSGTPGTGIGTHLWNLSGVLLGNLVDTNGVYHSIQTPGNYLLANTFQHVALTYDCSSGVAVLYLNGNAVVTNNLGVFVPQTSYDLWLGRRAGDSPGNSTYGSFFGGLLDEPSVYNRALALNEIQAVYNAGSAGKCVPLASSCVPPPAGIIAWWPANGDATDIIGGNNTTLVNGTGFATGEVGTAFNLNGANNYVLINPATTNLTSGLGNGFTFEGWINPQFIPATGSQDMILFVYERVLGSGDGSDAGVHLAIHDSTPAGAGGGCLYANVKDTSGNDFEVASPAGVLAAGIWQHIALSYDKASGKAVIYVNGSAVSQTSIGSFNPSTVFTNLLIGARTFFASAVSPNNPFAGAMDELSFYSRALSTNEIAAIYRAGIAGKCFTAVAPVITAQPQSETNIVGGAAIFNVTASGTGPLSYQWSWNGTNIGGATNAALTLTNLQLTQAGNYSVLVSNVVGSTNSALATLTISSPASCDPPPSGLVAWWPGNGDTSDIIGGNNGTLQGGIAYAVGEVGQSFSFNDTNAAIFVPASASLNVGAGGGFTLEAWIQPTEVTNITPIFEWNAGDGITYWGVHFWICPGQPFSANPGPGELYANIVDTSGGYHQLSSNGGATAPGVLQHVALAYDKTTGLATIFCNGVIVAQQNLGSFTPQTAYKLYLGRRPGPDSLISYAGLLDEPSVYNRALTADEIVAIYNAGNLGKCFTPMAPLITAQPQSQTNVAGGSASLSVTASGTGPLSYQWNCNGTNISGATNATLTLANLRLTQAGNYSVLVSNIAGQTNSSVAILTITSLATCEPAPSGIAGWWLGEGNADDVVGGDNGISAPDVAFVVAKVGRGFALNDTNAYVRIPASAALNVGTGAGLTLEAWIYPTNVTGLHPIFEWNSGVPGTGIGTHLWNLAGVLLGNLVDTNGAYHSIQSPGSVLMANTFQHVALTYNTASGIAVLYLNSNAIVTNNLGVFVPQTSFDLWLGRRAGDSPGNSTYGSFFGGVLDEPSVYTRALTLNEIAAIYNAGSAGKCFTAVAPVITAQPQSQTNFVGGTATFSVAANGTSPLSYVWSWNGTNIDGATNATLMLNNVQLSQAGNYSVQVSNLVGSTNSMAATLTVLVPPFITQQPQSQTTLSYNAAGFTVAASGTGPLSYQWRKGGTNLVDGGNVSGSTTTNLILTSVSLADAGNYDVVVSTPYAATNSAVAVLTVPQTGLALGPASAMSGTTVVVPVLMNSLGVENTFLATVGYDPTKLVLQSVQLGSATAGAYVQEVDTKTNAGLVGFAILLSGGSTVPVGTNEQVALLNFLALPVTSNTTVSLFFTNTPTLQQTYDNNFNLLPTIYSGGTASLLPAEYAADVFPRTNSVGDHQVTVQDWLELGRMVAGLDTPTNTDEMLRADCAPRNAPDSVLTVADWVQAGRYALGLDPLTLVTPPPGPLLKLIPHGGPLTTRTLQIGSITAQRGQMVSVPVQLVCTTNENAVGLTVSFDPNQLTLNSVTMGSAMAGGRTNINYSQPGKLGIVVAMSPGASLAAGTNQLLLLQLTASTNASGPAALSLDNSVAKLQVADKTANVLAANYANGAVILPAQPTLTTAIAGAKLQLTWPVSTGTFQVQSANSPAGPWSNAPMSVITNGANATVTVTATNQQQYFRLVGQ